MQKISTFFITAFFLCSLLNISAQTLPAGTTNRGTDFWLSFPVSSSQGSSGHRIAIYVSCEVAVPCTLTIPGLGIQFIKPTTPNGITEFSLTPLMAQVYNKDASSTGAEAEQIYSGRGVHISAPVPITVSALSRFNNISDSFLALPTSALGKEYIVASYAEGTGNSENLHLMSQTVIVAAYDNTTVNFTLGGRVGTQTVGGMKTGEMKSFKMMKGDVIVFANKKIKGIYGDISGSIIRATKPVAVISGNQCAFVDITTAQCDYIAEMELPIATWGKDYHITNIKDRKKYSYVKIFAKESNTRLYRDGESTPFAVLPAAGGVQNSGYFEGRVFHDSTAVPRPIMIRSDKPISITQFNPGQSDDSVQSEPFQMVLTPVEQYQKEITFTTPGSNSWPDFLENYINLVFEAQEDGAMPEDLEFGTVDSSGTILWKSLQSVFGPTATLFNSHPDDTKKYFQKTITLPRHGTYKIRALKPFAAYQYGYHYYSPYAHPASVSLKDLTVNDTKTPALSFIQECSGNVSDGTVKDSPAEQSSSEQRSNLALITLLAESHNYILQKEDFIAGDASTAWWKLRVEDHSQNATAHVYFTDRAGNDTTIIISYSAPKIAFDDSILNFGFLKVNESKTMTLEIRNMSQTAAQTITAMRFKGSYGFTFTNQPTLPIILQPSESRTFEIQFMSEYELPPVSDSVLIEVNGCTHIGSKLQVRTGSEPLLEVTDADFGSGKVNTDSFKTIKLKNLGTFPLKITGYSGPSTPEFTLTGWPVMSENSPYVLDFGGELRLIVVFNAGAEGEYNDEIVFKSNAKISGTDSIGKLRATAVLTVGIEELQNSSFTISPNPATGFATITLPAFKSQNVFLKIFDAAGNEVADFSNDLLKTDLRFDTKSMPNGVYFLRFTDGKTTLNRSFIIQN